MQVMRKPSFFKKCFHCTGKESTNRKSTEVWGRSLMIVFKRGIYEHTSMLIGKMKGMKSR